MEQRIEILDWHNENGKIQVKTVDHFDKIYPNLKLKQPTLSKWIKSEQEWRGKYESNSAIASKIKRARQTQHPEVTEMMDLWVTQATWDGVLLTGEVLRQKWTAFADLVGVPAEDRLNLSNGWLDRFMARLPPSVSVQLRRSENVSKNS